MKGRELRGDAYNSLEQIVTAVADDQEIRSEADSHTEAWRAAAEAVAEQIEW